MDKSHKTTLTSKQRKMLVHSLSQFHDMKDVAELTDREIHLQWMAECEYCPKEFATLPLVIEEEEDEE